MKPDCWKLWDDDESAVVNGTPFRVSYFVGGTERSVYFKKIEDAFAFAQSNPRAEHPVIKNAATFETLFPKDTGE